MIQSAVAVLTAQILLTIMSCERKTNKSSSAVCRSTKNKDAAAKTQSAKRSIANASKQEGCVASIANAPIVKI